MTLDTPLSTLRAVCDAATPGPWEAITDMELLSWDAEHNISRDPRPDVVFSEQTKIVEQPVMLRGRNGKDMQFIATFDPPTVRAMLDRIEELETEQKLQTTTIYDKTQRALLRSVAADAAKSTGLYIHPVAVLSLLAQLEDAESENERLQKMFRGTTNTGADTP